MLNKTFKIIFLCYIFITMMTVIRCLQKMIVHPLPKHRSKRWLIFPPGDNYIQFILGFGLPVQLDERSITIGTVLKCTYRVPNDSTQYENDNIITERKKRSTLHPTRWHIYHLLANIAERFGFGGKACVLLTICQVAEIPFEQDHSIFEELLHTIFTPSMDEEGFRSYSDTEYLTAENYGRQLADCKNLFHECKINFLDLYTKIQ